jgi:hypothetical protein
MHRCSLINPPRWVIEAASFFCKVYFGEYQDNKTWDAALLFFLSSSSYRLAESVLVGALWPITVALSA